MEAVVTSSSYPNVNTFHENDDADTGHFCRVLAKLANICQVSSVQHLQNVGSQSDVRVCSVGFLEPDVWKSIISLCSAVQHNSLQRSGISLQLFYFLIKRLYTEDPSGKNVMRIKITKPLSLKRYFDT